MDVHDAYQKATLFYTNQQFDKAQEYYSVCVKSDQLPVELLKNAFLKLINILETSSSVEKKSEIEIQFIKFLKREKEYSILQAVLEQILKHGVYGNHKIGMLLENYAISLAKVGEIKKSKEALLTYLEYLLDRKNVIKASGVIKNLEISYGLVGEFENIKLYLNMLTGSTVQIEEFFKKILQQDSLTKKYNEKHEKLFRFISTHIEEFRDNAEALFFYLKFQLDTSQNTDSLFVSKLIESIILYPYDLRFYFLGQRFYLIRREASKAFSFNKFISINWENEKFYGKDFEFIELPNTEHKPFSGNEKETGIWDKTQATKILRDITVMKSIESLDNMEVELSDEDRIARDIKFLLMMNKRKRALLLIEDLKKINPEHQLITKVLKNNLYSTHDHSYSEAVKNIQDVAERFNIDCNRKENYARKKNALANNIKSACLDFKDLLWEDALVALIEIDELESAKELIKEVLKSSAYNSQDFFKLEFYFAQICFRKNEYYESIEKLEEILDVIALSEDEMLETLFLLGNNYESLSKNEKAISIFKEILNISSHYRDTNEKVKKLEENK